MYHLPCAYGTPLRSCNDLQKCSICSARFTSTWLFLAVRMSALCLRPRPMPGTIPVCHDAVAVWALGLRACPCASDASPCLLSISSPLSPLPPLSHPCSLATGYLRSATLVDSLHTIRYNTITPSRPSQRGLPTACSSLHRHVELNFRDPPSRCILWHTRCVRTNGAHGATIGPDAANPCGLPQSHG